MKAVADPAERAVQEGGIIHEDSLWDANEMALDGASTESIARRIKDAREGEQYRPKGRRTSRWRPAT
jgi:hypothetical protein